jgi:hypothetical protein
VRALALLVPLFAAIALACGEHADVPTTGVAGVVAAADAGVAAPAPAPAPAPTAVLPDADGGAPAKRKPAHPPEPGEDDDAPPVFGDDDEEGLDKDDVSDCLRDCMDWKDTTKRHACYDACSDMKP